MRSVWVHYPPAVKRLNVKSSDEHWTYLLLFTAVVIGLVMMPH